MIFLFKMIIKKLGHWLMSQFLQYLLIFIIQVVCVWCKIYV